MAYFLPTLFRYINSPAGFKTVKTIGRIRCVKTIRVDFHRTQERRTTMRGRADNYTPSSQPAVVRMEHDVIMFSRKNFDAFPISIPCYIIYGVMQVAGT